jgi:hypothetical protein
MRHQQEEGEGKGEAHGSFASFQFSVFRDRGKDGGGG